MALPCLFGLLSFGCGGQVEGGHDGGAPASSADEAGAGDDGGGRVPIVIEACPSDPPPVGAACSTPNHGCAYTDFGGVACQAYLCDASGHWASTTGGC